VLNVASILENFSTVVNLLRETPAQRLFGTSTNSRTNPNHQWTAIHCGKSYDLADALQLGEGEGKESDRPTIPGTRQHCAATSSGGNPDTKGKARSRKGGWKCYPNRKKATRAAVFAR